MRTIAIIVGSVIVVLGALTIAAPSIIQAMGVHKEYTGRRYELLGGGKALIIATNHDELGGDGTPKEQFTSRHPHQLLTRS